MKLPFIILLSIGPVAILIHSGCARFQSTDHSKLTQSGQRVIRVSFRNQHDTFQLRINQSPIEKLKDIDFTNVMTRLQLDYGDIVVWEDQ